MHLLSYFIDKPVPYIKRIDIRKYSDLSFKSLLTDDGGYDSTMTLPFTGKYYEWQNNPNLMAYPAVKNSFKGKGIHLS